MRDYSQMQYRSPQQKQVNHGKSSQRQHYKVSPIEEEKKEASPTDSSTVGSSSTMPDHKLHHILSSGSPPRRGLNNNNNNNSPSPQTSPTNKSVTTANSSTLSASDALAMRTQGGEATVAKLRLALDLAQSQDATTRANLAKSDALIVDLKSSIRQVKRQMEKLAQEKIQAEHECNLALDQLQVAEERGILSNTTATDASQMSQSLDARVGELQIQLDRAHAQILTADMIRKELEDTLEAEQYTWELRIQDQERSIQQLSDECSTLAHDLEQCRSQWKEAEDGWTNQVGELQGQLDKALAEARHWKSSGHADHSELQEKILGLEQERTELQSCLDEALKELEAVDEELQGDQAAALREENQRLQRMIAESGESHEMMEPLQHLYRWLLERDGVDDSTHSFPKDGTALVAAIRQHLEEHEQSGSELAEMHQRVHELESQMSTYKGDLKAREESSAELRASLKEAVALLKPLQDAVAKADREKAHLQSKIEQLQKSEQNSSGSPAELSKMRKRLDDKDDQIDDLRQEIESLEIQLSKAKLAAASSLVTANNKSTSSNESFSKTREDLKTKRQSEKALRDLLRDAQSRFSVLHKQNQQVEAMNNELQDRLKSAVDMIGESPSIEGSDGMSRTDRDIQARSIALNEMDGELKELKEELSRKEQQMRALQVQLEEAHVALRDGEKDKKQLEQANARVQELELKLNKINKELKHKKHAEKALNKSLMEALNLVRPLQEHLEDAEQEKKDLIDEIQSLQQKVSGDMSRNIKQSAREYDEDHVSYLKTTVRQLENENAQLHDALEDMSQSVNQSQVSSMSQKGEARLREEIVELKSRYEVTQSRLKDAWDENHELAEELRNRELEERNMEEEIHVLREKLKRSGAEIDNAKFIATSALARESDHEGNGSDQRALYNGKSKEIDREMNSARGKRTVPYRLT